VRGGCERFEGHPLRRTPPSHLATERAEGFGFGLSLGIAAAPFGLAALEEQAPEVPRHVMNDILEFAHRKRALLIREHDRPEDRAPLELETGARIDVQEDLAVARDRERRRERRWELRSARETDAL